VHADAFRWHSGSEKADSPLHNWTSGIFLALMLVMKETRLLSHRTAAALKALRGLATADRAALPLAPSNPNPAVGIVADSEHRR
jgi:hypothetical protein